MSHDISIGLRIPNSMKNALERERKRMSKAAGAEVKTSAVIRAILEQKLDIKRKPKASRAVA